ncbi:hypothetical protein GCM10028781_22840 [Nostocoides australiense]
MVQDLLRLPEVVERQAREDQDEPGPHDRDPPQVAHIGTQRLGAGDRQHHRTHRDEGDEGMTEREPDRVVGRKRAQDMGIGEDAGSRASPE